MTGVSSICLRPVTVAAKSSFEKKLPDMIRNCYCLSFPLQVSSICSSSHAARAVNLSAMKLTQPEGPANFVGCLTLIGRGVRDVSI